MGLIPGVGAVVGLIGSVAFVSWLIRRLGLRASQEVQTGRVGDQPVVEYREKTWVTLVMICSGLLGAGGGAALGWYVVRLIQGG